MPYRKRSIRRRNALETGALIADQVEHLFWGYVLIPSRPEFASPFRDDNHARATWEAHKAQLLNWWVVDGLPADFPRTMVLQDFAPCPGLRPWAWWQFDGRNVRRRLHSVTEMTERRDGTGLCNFTIRPARKGEEAQAWQRNRESLIRWGQPTENESRHGVPCWLGTDDGWETEYDCLKRLGLLLPGEAERVEAILAA